MRVLDRAILWFVRANQAVVIVAMAAMTLLVGANVISRYGFGESLAWSEELSRFLMIAVAYLGGGLALREGRLVAVDFLQDRYPVIAKPLRVVVAMVILAFLFILAWLGFQYASFAVEQETPVLGISSSIPYMIVPVGALAIGLHLIAFLPEFLRRDFEHDEDELGAEDGVALLDGKRS